jgi:subtilisin family serine protease
MSSLHNASTNDPRNSSYKIGKYLGTSMASPQVMGVLACILEIYPTFNQTQALDYLVKNSKYSQIYDTGGSYNDFLSLQGSSNRYLFSYKERADAGSTWPKLNYLPRPSSGRMFPRVRVRR